MGLPTHTLRNRIDELEEWRRWRGRQVRRRNPCEKKHKRENSEKGTAERKAKERETCTEGGRRARKRRSVDEEQ